MPLYDFKCPEDSVFEAFFTMQEKPGTVACPQCGQQSASLMPAISPSKTNSAQMRVMDATKATAEQPPVVNSISGTPSVTRQPNGMTQNPLHQKLPRP